MKKEIYLIFQKNSEAGTIETLPETVGMCKMQSENLKESNIIFLENDKVCMTSEACLDIVKEKISSIQIKNAIEILKDKIKFRDLIKTMYPNYNYQNISFDDIKNIDLKRKVVLKPQKGCFGTGVRILDGSCDLKSIADEIQAEINKNSSVLSESVLSKNDFILEDFIEGEEYAVDLFFDDEGNPQVVNIYHHPMPKEPAYLHMIYYTSKEVFQKIFAKAIQFFKELNKSLNLKNFILHGEFRYTTEGVLFPIEINAMRFGGMGLGNLVYYSLGINPYDYFRQNLSPNWDEIWSQPENAESIYAFFIAYNGKSINKEKYKPDLEKLKGEFTDILNECIFNYKDQLAFGTFSLRETKSNLKKLLNIEFDNYFEPTSSP